MGDSTPQPNAQSLRAELEGLSRFDAARFATTDEIQDYMEQKGFHVTGTDGEYSNDKYILSDMRPKNVLVSYSGAVAVIDADVVLIK